jgi:hypothetical protein
MATTAGAGAIREALPNPAGAEGAGRDRRQSEPHWHRKRDHGGNPILSGVPLQGQSIGRPALTPKRARCQAQCVAAARDGAAQGAGRESGGQEGDRAQPRWAADLQPRRRRQSAINFNDFLIVLAGSAR